MVIPVWCVIETGSEKDTIQDICLTREAAERTLVKLKKEFPERTFSIEEVRKAHN